MAINTAPLIIGGVGLLALLLGAESGKTKRPGVTGKREPVGPIPVPQTDEHLLLIDQTICDCWESLGRPADMAKVRSCVATALHPDVPFPPVPEDHATVRAVWELFTSRTQAFLAATDKVAWCAGLEEGIDPLEVLEELVSVQPTPGKFYMVGSNPELQGASDSFSKLVRSALNGVVPGAGQKNANRLDYMHCITSGPRWNWKLYASPSFSDKFPEYTGVNGMGLRRAFFPWNQDAREAIANRVFPKRAITTSGARIAGLGNTYGMLWLPPVDADMLAQQDIVTCANVEWSDGSSSIDPPSDLLNALAEA